MCGALESCSQNSSPTAASPIQVMDAVTVLRTNVNQSVLILAALNGPVNQLEPGTTLNSIEWGLIRFRGETVSTFENVSADQTLLHVIDPRKPIGTVWSLLELTRSGRYRLVTAGRSLV
jgi:hypothetical protein